MFKILKLKKTKIKIHKTYGFKRERARRFNTQTYTKKHLQKKIFLGGA